MGPLIMLYHIELFEYTLSQFCSRFTLLLELEWPNSWDSKIGDFCEETVLPMCDFWPGCVEYLTHCLLQLPLAPSPPLPLYTIYLTVGIGMAKSCDSKQSKHEILLPIKMTKPYNRHR